MDLRGMLPIFAINLLPFLSVVYVVSGIRYFWQKQSKRINFFSLTMFACAIYCVGYYLEIQAYNPELLLWVRGFEFIGVMALPSVGMVYIAEATNRRLFSTRILTLMASLSAVLWISYITNPLHHLFYTSLTTVHSAIGTVVQTVKGPFYYLLLAYYCVFLVMSVYLLTSTIFGTATPDKGKDKKILLAAFLFPWIPLIVILLGYDDYMDPVPFAIIIMSALFLTNEIIKDLEEKGAIGKEYQQLIFQMQQGLATHEIILDQFGKPVDYRFLSINDSFEKLTGLKRKDIIGKRVLDVLPNTEPYWIQVYGEVALTGKPYHYINYSVELDRYYDVYAYAPKPRHFAVLFSDVTEYKELEHNLHIEKELFRTTVMSVADGIISANSSGKVILMNGKAEQLTGYRQEAAEGKELEQVLYMIDFITRERWLNPAESVYASQETISFDSQIILLSHTGHEIPVEGTISPIISEAGTTMGSVVTFRDITEKKKKQDEILYLSYHDQLTGLYNRRYFEEEIKRLDTERNLPMTLVMFDVNGLKLINDAFGHQTADQVLQTVAWALRRECRSDDIIARIGGDEFVLILPKTDEETALIISDRIHQSIRNERVQSLQLSVSYGLESKITPEVAMTEIFKNAENNMYVNKLAESADTRQGIVDVVIKTMNDKNKPEAEHFRRVSMLCTRLGEQLKLSPMQVMELKTLGLVHDIGKISVREDTLNKKTPLTIAEWTEIKRHSEIGFKILSSTQEYIQMAEHVLHQHEYWDGTGYPKGLKGPDISIQSRIIAVADAYDVMTSDWPYHKAVSHQEALEELKKNAGIQFDPAVVAAFEEM